MNTIEIHANAIIEQFCIAEKQKRFEPHATKHKDYCFMIFLTQSGVSNVRLIFVMQNLF